MSGEDFLLLLASLAFVLALPFLLGSLTESEEDKAARAQHWKALAEARKVERKLRASDTDTLEQ